MQSNNNHAESTKQFRQPMDTLRDTVMNNTVWIGVFPALNTEMLDYTAQKISEFMGAAF